MVVTIVVLLILAGVSISLVVDKNGIIQKSKDARREYGQAKANEQEDLSNLSDMIDEATGKVAKIDVNTKASKNGTINGEEGNSNNPTIPKNYIPIDTATSTWGDGSTAPSQDSVNHGLVIKDEKNNEWVWVPVDKGTLATMYEESSDEKTLCGTTVTTNKYSKSEIISGLTRTAPGASTPGSHREPDLVVGDDGTGYDAKDTDYKTILGETGTKEQLAKLFVAEYNEMIASIAKYGGFYIGRYELSGTVTEPTEKSGKTLTETNWYNLYNACRSSKLQASDKVKTQMIWGCQWDVTCNFIANKGDQKNIIDSSTWGNYKNYNTANNYTEGTAGYEKNAGSKQNTGSSENWKANNIYDLAGNCDEWTQEAKDAHSRAERGGVYDAPGSFDSALINISCTPISNGIDDLRFSSHFNNKVTLRV